MEDYAPSNMNQYFQPLNIPFTSIENLKSREMKNHFASLQTPPVSPETLDLSTASLKRNYKSRSSSTSPELSQSSPKRRTLCEVQNHSPNYSMNVWNIPRTAGLSSNMANINILNATFFKCKNDLMIIHTKRVKVQQHLNYLVDTVWPNKRNNLPALKVKQEQISEVINTTNFFYNSISEEVQQNSQQLNKILGVPNHGFPTENNGASIAIGNLVLKSKQILRNVAIIRDLDTNMVAIIDNVLEKVLLANLDSKFNMLITHLHCWLLDLLVNLLPGYTHRLMGVSAAREARGISVKECRSRKRCISDWLSVAKSLNSGKIELYTTLNRFTAIAGVSAMLQCSGKENPIKEIISTSFNDDVVQKTYKICQNLEEAIEPLKQIQKILAFCLVNEDKVSSLMIDEIHNPLFEKRLYGFRAGPSCSFPKQLIGELEKLFHQDFIQGPTFFATQQYERRCCTCQQPLGQECYLCIGCNLVRYCGDNCAKADESNHETICNLDRFEILKTFLEKVSEEKNCHEIEVV